ncbi:MAG: hypothetical protein QG670_2604 [Thermoproteota archaeon]|nr:hypothetical protein [Thermoproteota archaeon]
MSAIVENGVSIIVETPPSVILVRKTTAEYIGVRSM